MRKKLFFQDLGNGIQMLETLRYFKTGVISKDIFLVVISSPQKVSVKTFFLGGSNPNKENYHLKFYCLEQRHYQGGF